MPEPQTTEKIYGSYEVLTHGITAHIRIADKGEFTPSYDVTVPGVGEATKILITSLRQELLVLVPLDTAKITDPEYVRDINRKYESASALIIDKYLPGTRKEVKDVLVAYMINIMLGLGDLEVLLADENLEEIAVNSSKEPVWVFHKDFGWCRTNIRLYNEEVIYDDAEQIGRRVGRQINNLQPLMDAELQDGSRVNATLFPISQRGNTITIRKFSKNPWTMTALIKEKSVSLEVAAMIWLCVQNEISLVISGGTASGKTSFLNAISIFMQANHRVISVEETRELTLPEFLQWVPMLTRQPNPEGKGQINLYDLMINALRQRPDIILVGEIRTKSDAQTLFEAIHTGHAVYGTIHADNAEDTIVRMTNPPIDIPKVMLNSIGGVISLFRHRRLGIRRVLEFAELERSGDATVLYRWNLRTDSFTQISEVSRLAEVISLYGGYTRSELLDDIREKAKVLNWMVKNKIMDVNGAGFVIANYYKNKDRVMQVVNSDIGYSADMLK